MARGSGKGEVIAIMLSQLGRLLFCPGDEDDLINP